MGPRGLETLASELRRLRQIATGRVQRELGEQLKKTALSLVARGWDSRETPRGAAWRPGRSGAATLQRSGAMRAALRADPRSGGFALTIRVAAPGGQLYGGTQNWGRTLKAKTPRGQPGAKPMRWRSRDGRWHSAWKVRVPARQVLPRSGTLPPAWERELGAAASAILTNIGR